VNTDKISGINLAQYILKKLTQDGDTVQTLSHDFDDNEAFVLSVISFLEEVGWMKEAQDGSYMITDKGTFHN
jgi:predicted transcriptional regulator